MSQQTLWRIRTITTLLGIIPLTFGFIFLLMAKNINHLFAGWSEEFRISLYLDDSAQKAEVDNIKKFLLANPQVQNLEVFDQRKTFELFKTQMAGYLPELFEDDTFFSTLPQSVQFSYSDPSTLVDFKKEIEKQPGVQEVNSGGDLFDQFFKMRNLFSILSYAIMLFVLLFVSVNIASAIRQIVYLRKEEISILEILGATKNFIRKDFYLEALLTAAITTLISFSLTAVFFSLTLYTINAKTGLMSLQTKISFFSMTEILILLLIPNLISLVSSYISLKSVNTGWSSVE